MARRHWTVLVVSDDDTRIRQYRLSRELIRTAIGGSLLLAALVGSLGAGLLTSRSDDARVQRLARENALLRTEVAQMEAQASELDRTMEELAKRDEAFRLVAGLDPIHTDVLQAGIGGPGGETLEASPLFAVSEETATRAFATSERLDELLRRGRILMTSWTDAAETLESHQRRLLSTPSILPTRGYFTSGFTRSRMHPILHIARAHEGVDISAPKGTPILAAADGVVAFSGRNGDYGLVVEIDHGYGYITRYAHASELEVRTGQRVKRGDVIAAVGSTGLSVAPHLHYEVIVNGRAQNPRQFMLTGAIPD